MKIFWMGTSLFVYTVLVCSTICVTNVEGFSPLRWKPWQSKPKYELSLVRSLMQIERKTNDGEGGGEEELSNNRSSSNNKNNNHKKVYTPQVRAKIANSIAKGERRANERNHQPRLLCTNCHRPPQICVCEGLPLQKISTNTFVLILQHPNEYRKKNFSTVPLLKLVLEHTKVKLGYSFDYEADIQTVLLHGESSSSSSSFVKEIIEKGQKPLLLFPGPDAISLGENSAVDETNVNVNSKQPPQIDREDSLTLLEQQTKKLNDKNILILIDGTWSEARRMIRHSPTLVKHCQQIQFTDKSSATDTCIYDAMRKEPDGHCLSTLEACAQTLQYLEPTNHQAHRAKRYLNQALQTHVDAHLANSIQENVPRSETSAKALYNKNRRRREIEKTLFQNDEIDNYNGNCRGTNTDDTSHENQVELTGMNSAAVEQHAQPHSILQDGSILRPLKVSDAYTVDSWWDKRSSTTSHSKIVRLIMKDNNGVGTNHRSCCCCLGIEGTDGKLRACILRYEGGALGMLYVENSYRRLGYGQTLLAEATLRLEQQGIECVAFIVDGNDASETLFTKEGWVRADPTMKRKTGRRRAKRKWIKQT